ncbi:MAG: hypothetical protein EXQ96_01755 [Alphaproteobacteria bacterium]|nr:hypothetical protein [Alphaproteobacteria bacterium]
MSRTSKRTFHWQFDSPPEAVRPALADTVRFNEAAGLPKHLITEETLPDGAVRYFTTATKGPIALEWEEIPVEWVENRWFRHLRVFSRGPLRTLCATLELEPDGGGTRARYTVEASPGNLLGVVALATSFFPSVEKSFTSLAMSAREWAAGRQSELFPTPPHILAGATRERAEAICTRIDASPYGHGLAHRLLDWLLTAPEGDLMHLRPRRLARRLGVAESDAIELCLESVREGLLRLRWDLLCPRCRGAKLSVAGLDQLPRGAHCGACNIDYQRDFSRNVELTFTPSPAVRPVMDGEYCLFGPMSVPHVKVQVALDAGSERTIAAALEPGDYRLRTLEIGGEADIAYMGGSFPEVIASGGAVAAGPPAPPGHIVLRNQERRRRTLIVESRAWIADALTAHRATTLQAFRDLLSQEILRPGDEVGIAHVTLMFTDLRGSTAFYQRAGDAGAYHVVREHYAFLGSIIRAHGGAIVKTIGDAVMTAFAEPGAAMQAAIAVQRQIESFNQATGGSDVVIKLGLHAGPCIAVTLNDRLDYFGSTVNLAARLQGQSMGGDIVLSAALAADPAVAPLLEPIHVEHGSERLKGFGEPVAFLRLRVI